MESALRRFVLQLFRLVSELPVDCDLGRVLESKFSGRVGSGRIKILYPEFGSGRVRVRGGKSSGRVGSGSKTYPMQSSSLV